MSTAFIKNDANVLYDKIKVMDIVKNILERPDMVEDFLNNENTNFHICGMVDLAIKDIDNKEK